MTADEELHLDLISQKAEELKQLIADLDAGRETTPAVKTALAMVDTAGFWVAFRLGGRLTGESP